MTTFFFLFFSTHTVRTDHRYLWKIENDTNEFSLFEHTQLFSTLQFFNCQSVRASAIRHRRSCYIKELYYNMEMQLNGVSTDFKT